METSIDMSMSASMDICVGMSMDMSTDISMDVSMNISTDIFVNMSMDKYMDVRHASMEKKQACKCETNRDYGRLVFSINSKPVSVCDVCIMKVCHTRGRADNRNMTIIHTEH